MKAQYVVGLQIVAAGPSRDGIAAADELHRNPDDAANLVKRAVEHRIDVELAGHLRGFGRRLRVFDHRAGGADGQVPERGQASDDGIGHTHAPHAAVGVGGQVPEWKHGNAGDGGSGRRRGLRRIGAAAQPQQVRAHVGRALVAEKTIPLERLRDDAIELRRKAGVETSGGDGRPAEDRGKYYRRGRTRERDLPRRHLVEHGAEAEEIAARVERLGPGLLR